MINENQTPPFQSLQGFHKLVWDKSGALIDDFRHLFKISKQKCFNPNPKDKNYEKRFDKEKYKAVRLLDTFMSDSFILNMIDEIVEGSKNDDFRVEILLLNPFSKFAELRAKYLSINIFEHINYTLFRIRWAIYQVEDIYEENKHGKEYKKNKRKVEFMFEQLRDIHRFREEYNLEIRFYELLTETPFYLISLFIMKGFILFNSPSAHNPWIIFVDDPSQKNDLYDRLYSNFNEIWKVAKELPNLQAIIKNGSTFRSVFVSHGGNELMKFKIENFIEKDLGFELGLFQRDVQSNNLGISDKIKSLTDSCSVAIVILTKEDEQKFGEIKVRQNVLQELAYCQAKFGDQNVFFLVEEGSELSTDIHGTLCFPFTEDSLKASFEEIRKKINQIFEED